MLGRRLWQGALFVWLLGWALFGLPWTTFRLRPRMRNVSLVPLRRTRRRDQLLNFIFYVPFGVIGAGLGWPAGLVMASAAGLSAATELLQMFSSERIPSSTDLLLNTAGAIVGLALAVAVTARIRSNVTPS
jgi:glycopeptide antibiotics resistance protein